MRIFSLATFAFAATALALPVCAEAQTTQTTTQPAPQATQTNVQAPRSFWLVVTGLSGEAEIGATYNDWAGRITDAARTRFGAACVVRLAEAAPDSTTLSSKANIDAALRGFAAESNATDAVFIILIGHGSAADGVARIALPGPDLTATDLALDLSPITAHVTVINTTSTSGAWLAPLAAKGRIVVTSTRSGVEQNETTFAGQFATALSSDVADADKDGRISVLEAYDFAKREVERAYVADKKMLTEHAQIDGDGDGKAVATAAVDSPDGAVASLTYFSVTGAAGSSSAPQSPALRALYATKAQLEQQLATLRTHKTDMSDADYQKQLEALLLQIAENGAAIRELEGGK